MKGYNFLVLSLCWVIITMQDIVAQTLSSARQKTEQERYLEAENEFKDLLNSTNTQLNKGEIFFFYGENAYRWNDIESAKKLWIDGFSADAENIFARIGKGKELWLNADTAQANVLFEEVLKQTKRKNSEIIRQIASIYIDGPIKKLQTAVELLQHAIKIEPKNAENYLLIGDAQAELNPRNSSEAMRSYNHASDLHNDARAVVRKAKIYQRAQNPKLADSLYVIAQTIEPNYAPAYRERAELNMRFNQTKIAIENWEKYLQLNDSDYARYRYATSLFEQQQYQQTIEEINILHNGNFKNVYTLRMFAYAQYEVNNANNADSIDYINGWNVLNELFETTPKEQLIGYDFRYKAWYYKAMKQIESYLQEMEVAAEFDPRIATEIYTELAKYYLQNKDYEQTIVMYNKKMNGDSTQLSLSEYYDLARAYFFGPKDYEKCDQAHAYIIEQAPDYAMSYLWRGRANVRLDTEKTTYAAKPYYEDFLNLITEEQKEGQYKAMAIEAYKFLGDYYYSSPEKNLETAASMWDEVLKLSPEDAQAKAFFNVHKKVRN